MSSFEFSSTLVINICSKSISVLNVIQIKPYVDWRFGKRYIESFVYLFLLNGNTFINSSLICIFNISLLGISPFNIFLFFEIHSMIPFLVFLKYFSLSKKMQILHFSESFLINVFGIHLICSNIPDKPGFPLF